MSQKQEQQEQYGALIVETQLFILLCGGVHERQRKKKTNYATVK